MFASSPVEKNEDQPSNTACCKSARSTEQRPPKEQCCVYRCGLEGACLWRERACPAHLVCDGCAQSPSLPVSPALCAIVATIWFPVCAHREITIVSFGYSLYAGWIGAVLCLVGGCVIVCCSGDAQSFGENRFYYSSGSSSPTHAKSAHV